MRPLRPLPALGLLAFGLLGCAPALAQQPSARSPFAGFTRRVDAIPVADGAGRAYGFPFLGGLDRPRPQLADVDGDGDLDLLVQESPGRMMFFEKTPQKWVWRSDRWQGLEVGEWSRLVDVDGDGDLDVMAESPYSFIRWWNNTGGAKAPKYAVGADTVKDAGGAPIYADRQNIPQFADLDCDGRLDLMLGRVDGTIARYELERVDPQTGPRFTLVSDRFENLQILTGEAAPDGMPPGAQPNVPGMPTGANVPQPSLHGANTMALADVDGDGDQDILWGDFFEPGLIWIRNAGTCAAPSMRELVPFPEGAPLRTSGYNAPAAADLDGDGDLDMIVGVIGGAYDPARTAADNLYRLEQTAPGRWATRTSRLLDGIDVGSESSPALADLDGDGDLDLVVGNRLEAEERGTAALRRWENVGTAKAPSFREAGRIDVAPGYQYAPAFGDLDGDGDQDLVLGTWRDALHHYRNEGGRFVHADSALVRLTRGSHASPTLADLDGDGDLDLVVGESSGTLNYWRNDGTRQTPKFVLVSDEWEGVRAGRRSAPRAVDLDGDGDQDLVVGTEAGPPLVLRNTGSRRAPKFAAEEVPRGAGLEWPAFTTPAFGDLDGDGDQDALVGSGSGGVLHLENGARR